MLVLRNPPMIPLGGMATDARDRRGRNRVGIGGSIVADRHLHDAGRRPSSWQNWPAARGEPRSSALAAFLRPPPTTLRSRREYTAIPSLQFHLSYRGHDYPNRPAIESSRSAWQCTFGPRRFGPESRPSTTDPNGRRR